DAERDHVSAVEAVAPRFRGAVVKSRWKVATVILVAALAVGAVIRAERRVVPTVKPENVTIAVDADGNIYWNGERLRDNDELCKRLESINPRPKLDDRKEAAERLCKAITLTPENQLSR